MGGCGAQRGEMVNVVRWDGVYHDAKWDQV